MVKEYINDYEGRNYYNFTHTHRRGCKAKKMVLNDKQLIFVREYFENGGSRADAVIKAGYIKAGEDGEMDRKQAANIGNRLMKCKSIKAYMTEHNLPGMNKREVRRVVEQDRIAADVKNMYQWKVGKLVELVNINMPRDGVKLEGQNLGLVISSIAELNKMQGHYAPTKSVSVDLRADADMVKLKELSNRLLLEYQEADKSREIIDNTLNHNIIDNEAVNEED